MTASHAQAGRPGAERFHWAAAAFCCPYPPTSAHIHGHPMSRHLLKSQQTRVFAGKALIVAHALQAGGPRFEPGTAHSGKASLGNVWQRFGRRNPARVFPSRVPRVPVFVARRAVSCRGGVDGGDERCGIEGRGRRSDGERRCSTGSANAHRHGARATRIAPRTAAGQDGSVRDGKSSECQLARFGRSASP